jgi:hypothetical protein
MALTRDDCEVLLRAALVALRHVNDLLDEAFAKCEAQRVAEEQTGRI